MQMMKRLLSTMLCGAVLSAGSTAWAAEDSGNPIGRFDIARFQVDGNSLLSADELQGLLSPFTGKGRNFGDVQRALEALENAYHKRGYSVVQVQLPEQELNQGVVHLRVVEPRIGKVTVEGNRYSDQANIRRSLPALREGEVPNISRISSNLHLANENPAKKTAMQLKSADKDDQVDAVLRVDDDKPWLVSANLDNAGNSSTGLNHVGVVYQQANMFGLDHVLSLQYTTTVQKPSQVSIYGAGYHVPLYSLGDSLDVFASYSDVDSGSLATSFGNISISGKGTLMGLRYNQNLGRDKDYESRLVYGLDYKAYQSNVLLASAQLGGDVTVHPLSLSYAGTWTLASGAFDYYLSAMENIPGGSKGDSAAFAAARVGAPVNYKLLRFGANLNEGFARDWQVRVALNGQYTNAALIPGEQFGAGGATSVRGYDEREISDDSGYSANAELYTPNFCSGAALSQCRVLAFLDGAHVTRNNPLPGEPTGYSIGSVGVGLRLAAQKYFSLQVDAGRALRTGVTTAKGDSRVHFRMNFSY
jgi:hemolysin activation/secretion protein